MSSKETQSQRSGSSPELPTELSLLEVSRSCAVQLEFIIELIEEGVVVPSAGQTPESWRLSGAQLRHVTVAWRLQRDLGVNLAGAALALQLLDEVETLRAQITTSAAATDDGV